jgi:hypothetical protein
VNISSVSLHHEREEWGYNLGNDLIDKWGRTKKSEVRPIVHTDGYPKSYEDNVQVRRRTVEIPGGDEGVYINGWRRNEIEIDRDREG